MPEQQPVVAWQASTTPTPCLGATDPMADIRPTRAAPHGADRVVMPDANKSNVNHTTQVAPDDSLELERAQAGDGAALARLYDRHASAMLGLAVRFLRDTEDAEDLVHDVFVEAWQRAGTYDPKRASVRAWLLIKVRSRALDRLRHSRLVAAKQVTLTTEPTSAEPLQAREADHTRAWTALTALNEPQREVLELAYFAGLTCRQIAARRNLPEGTVKSRLAAGMAQLRHALAG